MSEDPKENMARVSMKCCAISFEDCAYFKKGVNWICEFGAFGQCNSSLARANAMILELKKMGIEIK